MRVFPTEHHCCLLSKMATRHLSRRSTRVRSLCRGTSALEIRSEGHASNHQPAVLPIHVVFVSLCLDAHPIRYFGGGGGGRHFGPSLRPRGAAAGANPESEAKIPPIQWLQSFSVAGKPGEDARDDRRRDGYVRIHQCREHRVLGGTDV